MAGRSFLLCLVPFAHLAIAVALPQIVNEVMVMTTVTLLPGQTAPSGLPDSSDDSFSSSWSGNDVPIVENNFATKQKHYSGKQGQNGQPNQALVQQQQPAPSSTVPVQPQLPITSTPPVMTSSSSSTTTTTGDDTTDEGDTTGAGSSGTTTCSSTPPSTMSDLLDRHNYHRKIHQAGNLCWDAALASNAQQDSSRIGCGQMQHTSQGEGVGENLMNGQSSGTAGAVDGWYAEISQYDWSNPVFKNETGHFTQVVWKGSTSLGCDVSCGLLRCQYKPPGNMAGAFEDNVLPAK